jgi:hypothetical protein
MLKRIPFALAQSKEAFRRRLRVDALVCCSLMSSAKKRWEGKATEEGDGLFAMELRLSERGLIKILKRRGERMEPWSRPLSRETGSVRAPLTTIVVEQLVKRLMIKEIVSGGASLSSNIEISLGIGTVS